MIRGVRPDGSLATAAWGRRDLGQFPKEILGQHNGNSTQTAARNSDENDCQGMENTNRNVSENISALDMERNRNMNMNMNMNMNIESEFEVDVIRKDSNEPSSSSSIKIEIDNDQRKQENNVQNITSNKVNNISDSDKTLHCSTPHKLSLPNGLSICEIWAGSEFTVVADEQGFLWSSGWNEHGNLGRGSGSDFVSSDDWVKVMRSKCVLDSDSHSHSDTDSSPDPDSDCDVDSSSPRSSDKEFSDVIDSSGTSTCYGRIQKQEVQEHVRLSVVWEGALACGGGHVLCLTDF